MGKKPETLGTNNWENPEFTYDTKYQKCLKFFINFWGDGFNVVLLL